MPWGNPGKALSGPSVRQYTMIGHWDVGVVPLETDINAWNSFLALKPTGYAGHWYIRVPNWVLPLVAAAILALAVTARGRARSPQQFWTVGLSLFGAAFMFLVVHATVFRGYHDLAMLGVFLLFVALFLKSATELILARLNVVSLRPAQARNVATWMLISAAVGLLPLLWAGWFFQDNSIVGVFRSFIVIIGVPVSLIIGGGALRMLARPSSRFAQSCSVLAMLPCYAGVLIGLPAGIYSLSARKEETRTHSVPTTPTNGSAPDSGARDRIRYLVLGPADGLIVVACVALLTAIGMGLWLWLAPTAPLLQRQTKTTLQMMAVTHGACGVFMLAAGLLLRRLRARMLVLLIATIVGIAIPAMLALNVIMEWGRIPQWPVMIPVWLGVPVAVWATVVLFRDHVRTAFQAASQHRTAALKSDDDVE
jgi:hypothetical protein